MPFFLLSPFPFFSTTWHASTGSLWELFLPTYLAIGFGELFTPEWLTAFGTVGAVFLALALAIWGEKINRLANSPKLSLKTSVHRPNAEKTKWTTATGQDVGAVYFFRLAVYNSGNAAAHDVQVFLSSVELAGRNGSHKISQFTPMNLKWSYRGNATLPALLPDMPPVYCDMVHINQPQCQGAATELTLDVEFQPNNQGHILKQSGTYHFHLILAAANCPPRKYKLEIIFPGTWSDEEDIMFREGFMMRAISRDG